MCWGRNSYGQLGNDTRTDSKAMVSVVALSDAVEIEAGGDFSCARRRSGAVVCWGNNQNGQLGDGQGAKVGAWSTGPTAVAGLTDATDVGVGEAFACALRRGGTVVCWGAGEDGQIGSNAMRAFANPRRIPKIANVASLAVGAHHVCVAERSGQVSCWGRNAEGQLGDGNIASRTNPRPVQGIGDAKSLISGGRHTCALRGGGKVSCWGDNGEGQLGIGGETGDARTPKPVAGLNGMSKLVAGDQHSCALFSGSDLRCWGDNREGQVDQTMRPRRTPFKVAGVRGVVDVAAGHRHTCVLSGGKVYCWGLADRSALGPNPRR
jgi:alpha-tubulin suppressor-like RCC1 family protein